jgi:RNA polymerase sigma-70 factor (ECF subfamily)
MHAWDWTAVSSVCLREARRVLGTSALAEDAAQEAAIRAWRRRRSCRSPGFPDAWVATIARREAYRLAAVAAGSPLEPAALEARPAAEPADVIDRLAIAQALDALDATDRGLVVGRYWDDLSYSELAKRFDMPVSTVGVRLHRIRIRLRENLLRP